MTEQSSENSTSDPPASQKKEEAAATNNLKVDPEGLEVDSGISFETSITGVGIRLLYEFVETLDYPDTPITLTFHISAHAELADDDEYKEFQAPLAYLKAHPPQAVAYIAYQLGKLLSQHQAGFRVQDFFVDNTVDRYTVKIILRPIGLPDLVNINGR